MSRIVRTLVLHLEGAEEHAGCPAYFEEEEPVVLAAGLRTAVTAPVVIRRGPLCWKVEWEDEEDPGLVRTERRKLLAVAESILRRLQASIERLRSEEGL